MLIAACKKACTSRSPGRGKSIVTCVCCAALCGFPHVKSRPSATSSDIVAQKLLSLVDTILEFDGGEEAYIRVAAQLFGCAACVGSDSFVVRCVEAARTDIYYVTMANDHRQTRELLMFWQWSIGTKIICLVLNACNDCNY